MAQPQIPEPYPGFPVLLSDPSLSGVPETTLWGCSLSSKGSAQTHLLPHVAVMMPADAPPDNKHKEFQSFPLYAAHLKIFCLATLECSQFSWNALKARLDVAPGRLSWWLAASPWQEVGTG